jgi:DNA polymerase III delta prime subunit
VRAGSHPDIVVVAGERTLRTVGVEDIRGLQSQLSRTPLLAEQSVAILPDAHRLSHSAQNALLKALEEPRARSLLILTVTHHEALLPTLVSRMRLVRLRPIPLAELAKAARTQGKISEKEAVKLARYARGISGAILEEESLRAGLKEERETYQGLKDISHAPFWRARREIARRFSVRDEQFYPRVRTFLAQRIHEASGREGFARDHLRLYSSLSTPLNKDLVIDALGIFYIEEHNL